MYAIAIAGHSAMPVRGATFRSSSSTPTARSIGLKIARTRFATPLSGLTRGLSCIGTQPRALRLTTTCAKGQKEVGELLGQREVGELLGDIDPSDVDEAKSLYRERIEAKKAKDYYTADALEERMASLGVNVRGMDTAHKRRHQTRNLDDVELLGRIDPEHLNHARSLFKQWWEFKQAGDYSASDALQAQLYALGVDTRATFAAAEGKTLQRRSVVPQVILGDFNENDEHQIKALWSERVEAKRVQDYKQADAIQSQLYDMGVDVREMDLQAQVWSKRRNGQDTPARQRPKRGARGRERFQIHALRGRINPEDKPLIERKWQEREEARRDGDEEEMEELEEELEDLNVDVKKMDGASGSTSSRLGQRSRAYEFGSEDNSEEPPQRGSSQSLGRVEFPDAVEVVGDFDEGDRERIVQMYRARKHARRSRYWAKADAIMQDLWDLGVDVRAMDAATKEHAEGHIRVSEQEQGLMSGTGRRARDARRDARRAARVVEDTEAHQPPRILGHVDDADWERASILWQKRMAARKRRDFDEADTLKRQLMLLGVHVRGTDVAIKKMGSPGDWTCQSCGASVFARKTSCYKCGAPKDWNSRWKQTY